MTLSVRNNVIFLSSLILWAITPHPNDAVMASELPSEVLMNKEAGRGNWLFVNLRLESGEELPFFVDTGTTITCFDKSLEPRLGKRVGTGQLQHYGDKIRVGIYPAPKLSLGGVVLMTGSNVITVDFTKASSDAGRSVMGVLGQDCLQHYCIQLDFQAGKMRFLGHGQIDAAELVRSFPLTGSGKKGDIRPRIDFGNFLGPKSMSLIVDTGNAHDGDFETAPFRRAVKKHTLRVEADAVEGRQPDRAWLPNCVWNGQDYTDLLIGSGVNSIGLRFLARHLVTLDFPNRTMYLKEITGAPLPDDNMVSAAQFLRGLGRRGKLPRWPTNVEPVIHLEAHPNSETYDFRKEDSVSALHFRVSRQSAEAPWKLEKVWRTDAHDRLEEYPPSIAASNLR